MRYLAITLLVLLILLGFGTGLYTAYDWMWGSEKELRAAKAALGGGDCAQAEIHLKKYLETRPKSAEAHLLAAQAARRAVNPVLPRGSTVLDQSRLSTPAGVTGSYDKAEQHLKKYKELDGIQELLQMERLLLRAQQADLADVEPALWTWINNHHPETILILEALTKGYLQLYRLSEAQECLDQWLERRENTQALLWRGWVRERFHNGKGALEDYERVLQIDPDNDEARLQLAEGLLNLSRPEEALPHFTQLYQRQRHKSAVLLGLAQCRKALGQTDAARELLDESLANDANNVAALLERGVIALEDDKQLTQAESFLKKAAELAPSDHHVNYHYSLCLQKLGKKDAARKIQDRMAQIQKDLKRLAEVTKEVVAKPHDASLRCEAGAIFLRNGQDQEGLRWLASALAEEPKHRASHEALAKYFERIKKKDLADYHRRLAEQAASGQPGK